MNRRENLSILINVVGLHNIKNVESDNITVICCQHILESYVYLLKHIVSLGIKKENIYTIGKAYSTDIEIYNELVRDGYNISELSLYFDKNRSFDAQFRENICSYLSSIQIPANNNIILLDDGAFLINEAPKALDKNKILFAIEQTSAGYNCLKNALLCFPIYNVARAEPKLTLEYKFLAGLIKKIIKRKAPTLRNPNKKCLLLGNGHLGAVLMSLLKSEINCDVFDINHRRTVLSKEEIKWDRYDLIIGATGKTSLRYLDRHKLKRGCLLVSVSSSDREFDAANFRENIFVNNCHSDIITDNGVFLINCGFPINFTGKTELRIKDIQLTIALMLEAFCEGLTKSSMVNGIINLDQNNLKAIKQFFLATR